GVPPDVALVARLTDVHMGLLQSVSHAPPHHAAVLARLRERFRIGLCSNFSHAPAARAVLERDGLARHFDAIVISHEHRLRKPLADIFHAPPPRPLRARGGPARSFDSIVISHEHGLRKPRPEIFEATLAALGVAPDE